MLRQLVKVQLVSRQLVKRPTGQIVEKIVTRQILNGHNLPLPLNTEQMLYWGYITLTLHALSYPKPCSIITVAC